MRHLSTFSGIGGIDYGFEQAGIETVCQVEIDAGCRAVLERHYPGMRRHDDIRSFDGSDLAGIDVLSGGVPCQDWSVAGKRAGLAGARSGLFFDFASLADRLGPRWTVFENVPGLLSACSCPECGAPAEDEAADEEDDEEAKQRAADRDARGHRGHDFATVLGELTGWFPDPPDDGWRSGGFCVGPKRSVAWRVLDAEYFGVAQRRHRLFVVGDSRGGAGPISVLLDPEGCEGRPAPRHETRAIAAGELARSLGGVGGGQDFGANKGTLVARPLLANSGRLQVEENYVAVETFVLQPDQGKGSGTTIKEVDVSNPLTAEGIARKSDRSVLIAFTQKDFGQDASEELSPTLRAMHHRHGNPNGGGQVAIAYRKAQKAHHSDDCERWEDAEVSSTLDAAGHAARTATAIVSGYDVRRLTPLECERLQAFPDEWTAGHSDGARYRMLGNAVPTVVARWIGERLVAAA